MAVEIDGDTATVTATTQVPGTKYRRAGRPGFGAHPGGLLGDRELTFNL